MKKNILILALLLTSVTFAKAQTPYAIWCQSNKTLYFVCPIGPPVETGEAYSFTEDNVVTELWSGTQVTNSGGYKPDWSSTVNYNLERVVFDESFKEVKPNYTSSWFNFCPKLTTIEGLQYLDTSEVTDMNNMFDNCSSLTSLDVSHFNTEKVTNMNEMFYNCQSLTNLDVSKFNTEKVIYMSNLFFACESLTSLDVSNFNTEKVTYMNQMFRDCYSLTSIDVNNFNTEKVQDMNGMFYGCSGLTTLNISNFKTSALQEADIMFKGCSNLKTIYCKDTWNVSSSDEMFKGCTSLVGEYGKTYSESDIDGTFANPGENGYFTIPKTPYALWCAGENMLYFVNTNKEVTVGNQYDFTENNAVTALWSGTDVTDTGDEEPKWNSTVRGQLMRVVFDESFKDVKPQSTNRWFFECFNLFLIEDLQYLDTSEVTDMSNMFDGCINLSSLEVSTFNTGKVQNMKYMFFTCSMLSSLDVSTFNTENVTDMNNMFSGCSDLSSLDVSKFKTEKVTDMSAMFEGCSELTTLDISSFKTTNLQKAINMFYYCSNLETIYCNDTWNVSESRMMFDDCTSLVGGCGKTYSDSDIDCTFANPGENGYFTLTRETLQGTAYDGAYWATYYNGFVKWVADDNTTVYVGRLSADNSELQLTEVTDKTINAGEAVILKSTAAEIKLTGTATVSTCDYTGNSLKGMDRASVVPTDEGTIYTLSIENDNMAFRQFIGNGLQARKAYLAINDASGAPIRVVIDGETTGIHNWLTPNLQAGFTIHNNGYYTIDGRYHNGTPTTRGLYIINGKKVLY